MVGSIKYLGCPLVRPGYTISRFCSPGRFDTDICLWSGLSIPLGCRRSSPVQIHNRGDSLTVTNLARQAPKRRGRGRRHPCSPMARPHHSCRGHGHPSCLARLGLSRTYRAGSDIPRLLAGPDLFLCFFYVAYVSFSSLPFPIDIAYASFLLFATSVVSR